MVKPTFTTNKIEEAEIHGALFAEDSLRNTLKHCIEKQNIGDANKNSLPGQDKKSLRVFYAL